MRALLQNDVVFDHGRSLLSSHKPGRDQCPRCSHRPCARSCAVVRRTARKFWDGSETPRELIAYVKKHCLELDGLLVYKVDRAARNVFDFVEIERLESEYGVPFLCVSQPTERNPAGRMMRRTLANMASFYTEQQSVDVQEGLARRVSEGWFVCKAPYGYRNVRRQGRGVVEIDGPAADNIRRIFRLYAYENCTVDGVVATLHAEGRVFRESLPSSRGVRSTTFCATGRTSASWSIAGPDIRANTSR